MSNKITLTELADILSVNSKLMSKKSDWENFLRLLFAEISDALYKDKVVKVKGLGTFKLVMVEPRKSVNIKTGEAVIIPSHAKISYTPDSTLAAVINKPYSHLEVTTLSPNGPVDPEEKEDLENDIIAEETKEATEEITTEHKVQTAVDPTLPTGIQRASEKIAEAIEKINSISENNVSAVEDAPKDEEQATEDTVPATEEATHSDENVSDSTQEEETKEEEEKLEEVRTETAAEQEQKNEVEAVEDAAPLPTSPIVEDKPAESSKSNSKKLGFALVIIVAFIGIFAAILWMSDPNIVNKIRAKINGGTEPAKTEATTVVPADTAQTTIKEDTVASAIKDSLIKDITEEAAAKTATPAAEDNETAQKPYIENKKIHFREDFVKYMKANHPSVDLGSDSENEEEIGKGDRLTLVSLRNYGQKDFWVYLYLYNYDKIKNPNNVRPGTKILIPALSSSLVNPDSEESINLAREIKAHFIKN
ncbi:MAG: HU family DNA-binding protein [Paludibacteraceae bacterium]|nr:HU family DNA-binding protein [Paludibacteraceae bacterium]